MMSTETFLDGRVTQHCGDVREVLASLPADHFDLVVTSPPYYGLRAYGTTPQIWGGDLSCDHEWGPNIRTAWANALPGPNGRIKNSIATRERPKETGPFCVHCGAWRGELGLEPYLGLHLQNLVCVFQAVRRVLKPSGVLFLNYGDCYATSPNGRSAAATKEAGNDDRTFRDKPFSTIGPIYDPNGGQKGGGFRGSNKGNGHSPSGRVIAGGFLKAKDLCMIPNRLAIALQDDGWWVRSEIVWGKTNPMPDSSGKYRPSTAHEKIFMLTKTGKAFYDAEAVALACSPNTHARISQEIEKQIGSARANGGTKTNGNMKAVVRKQDGHSRRHAGFNDRYFGGKVAESGSGIKNNHSMVEATCMPVDTRYLRNYEPADLTVWPIGSAPFSEAHFACVDAETEALTVNGWKKHGELQDGDMIAAYERTIDALVWQPATFHRYPFEGELVAVEKRDSSQRLTPNHRCLVRRRIGGVAVVEAADLKPGMEIRTVATLWRPADDAGPGDDFAALLGWYLTEGERRRHRQIRIHQSQSANPCHVATIRALLHRLNAEFTERSRTREWRGRPSVEICFSVTGAVADALDAHSADKKIDLSWVNWPKATIQALLDAIIDGDGHRRKDGRSCVVQKDRGFLDAIQILALRLGWCTRINKRKGGCHVLYITKGDWLTLRSADGKHIPIGRRQYDGIVWCPSVPSTFWIARRKGRTFITGNTFPPELAERCIKAGCPPGGVVLDPFGGAGTTALVAATLGRTAHLIELNPKYCTLARARIEAAFMGKDEGRQHMVRKTGKVESAGPLFERPGDYPE